MAGAFFDTNILIYAFAPSGDRKARAAALLTEGGMVSVQVLNEFVDVSRRKFKRDWPDIRTALDHLDAVLDEPLALTPRLHKAALDISERHGLRIYDGLIVAAAQEAGCRILYTEDLQHGQVLAGVTIHNPFRPA